jgi:succinate dehydrogenase/fumarate reductase cytochrome b subunit
VRIIKTIIATLVSLAIANPAYAQSTVTNPTGFNSIGGILGKVFTWLIAIIGVLAVIFIIIGGIRYILARGDPKATDAARGTITAAIIGLVIALLSVAIVIIVTNFLGGTAFSSLGGGNQGFTIGF